MHALGIICGFLAAFFQSLSYLATRHFVQPRAAAPLPVIATGGTLPEAEDAGRTSQMLLVLSHIWMGLASFLVLPFIWPSQGIPWCLIANPLLLTALFYLLGQIGLVFALQHAEPSRVSPMLGFKLVVLACLTTLLRTGLSPLQWTAAGVTVAAALVLNYTGGKTPPRALLAIAIACLAYSFSDWNIRRLVESLASLPPWRAFLLATFLCYALCGLLAVPFLPRLGSRRPHDWLHATPFAGAWLLAMVFLFVSFGIVGVVFGNILQSTRGLLSVLLSSALARAGLTHLESTAPPNVFRRRLAAPSSCSWPSPFTRWGQNSQREPSRHRTAPCPFSIF